MARDISHLAGDLKKRAETLEREIETQVKETRKRAGMVAKDAQLEVVEHDAGGDRRLSRVRSGKGAAVGIRFKVAPTGDVEVSATGPMPLLANPMPAHDIGAKRAGALLMPGPTFRGSVRHPGTPGKDTWNRGVDKATPRIAEVIGSDIDGAVRRGFHKGGE